MPDIKFPDVHLPEFKLPESFREMSREDIQRAIQDVRLPDVRLPDVRLPKRSDIAKNVEKALPMRSRPSPIPFAVLAMLGGLIVGWLLATSPLTGPRISAAMGGVRQKIDEWRTGDGLDGELDTAPEAFRDALRTPMTSETHAASLGSDTGATDGTSIGAAGVTSERS